MILYLVTVNKLALVLDWLRRGVMCMGGVGLQAAAPRPFIIIVCKLGLKMIG